MSDQLRFWASCVALFIGCGPATAQDAVTIEGGKTEGVATVNVVAGQFNQQANAGIIASGDQTGLGLALVQYRDQPVSLTSQSSVILADGAFAGSAGWIALSGTSGNGNQTANLATFLFGSEVPFAANSLLAQSRASMGPAADLSTSAPPDRDVRFGEGALERSAGVIQVNLVGGDNNMSANSFALSVETGAVSLAN